jgi:hypothetical protein
MPYNNYNNGYQQQPQQWGNQGYGGGYQQQGYGQQQQAPRAPMPATISIGNPMPSKYGNGMCASITIKAEGHQKGDKPIFKTYLSQNQYGFYTGLKLEQIQELHAALGAFLAQRGVGQPQYAPVQPQYQQQPQGYAQQYQQPPQYQQAPPQFQQPPVSMAQPITPPAPESYTAPETDDIPF